MDSLQSILTELSSIIGVPATLALAWAAFVVRDQAKQIKQLQAELKAHKKQSADDLDEVKQSFEAKLKAIVDKFEAKFEAAAKDQKEELRAIYNKIDGMAKNVATIMGFLFKDKHKDAE